MSEEQRQSSKLLEPRSFNAHKNAAAPMIVMLGCSEIDTKVSDADIKIMESDDCRGMLRDDGYVNSVLAMTQEGVRFFCKDGWKFINPFTQSISKLY